ncbi:hypothetical protein B7H20_18355 [Pseudomonas aeruginosa]|uniref:hypothetical protein n=1 Tax=Pseudomonas aeruginosa TaxID=287 RepID=UPI000A11E430|nr:hypothetical protein [Pseudomonas aeruginosa]ORL56799.1 hypothetical protein B7H20_18355 [Pseudomonas aeruginosa]HBP0520625.1 hypothetical protein [Pseudomonas aeruginosa]
MTTPISDEQLAELADGCIDSIPCPISALYELAERLIAAEADAKRYRWLRGFERGEIAVRDLKSHLHVEGLDAAIDEAMERTP